MILLVSGSSAVDGVTKHLLKSIKATYPERDIELSLDLCALPLFHVAIDKAPYPPLVAEWKRQISNCSSIILVTPVYLFNIPAVLKNGLEWLTTLGELNHKKVSALTFTPHEPRGEKAMQSVLWSLNALNAIVVCQSPMYQNEVTYDDEGRLVGSSKELMDEVIKLL